MSNSTEFKNSLQALICKALAAADQFRDIIEDADSAKVLDGTLLEKAKALTSRIDTDPFDPKIVFLFQKVINSLGLVIKDATRVEYFYMDDGIGKLHSQEIYEDHAYVAMELKKAAENLKEDLAAVRRYRRSQELTSGIY